MAQFLNKMLYAKEGAKAIMDRTFADLPWQIRLEVDGVEVEIPEVRFMCSSSSFSVFLFFSSFSGLHLISTCALVGMFIILRSIAGC